MTRTIDYIEVYHFKKKNDDGDLIFYLCNFTVGYYITSKNKHLLCVTVHLHSCFVRDLQEQR